MNGRNPLFNYAGSLACYPFGALAVLCLLGVSKYFKVAGDFCAHIPLAEQKKGNMKRNECGEIS